MQDLKSCLLQRDNEIAILVNMVKKGKTAEDVGIASRGSSRAAAAAENSNSNSLSSSATSLAQKGVQQRQAREEENVKQIDSLTSAEYAMKIEGDSDSNASNHPTNEYEVFQKREKEREKEKTQLIMKRHLFNVAPPKDREIFDDAAKSFDWFQERCSLRQSVDENREILRDKISEAKTVGERANQSRSTINYLKNSIEAIRREKALQRLDSSSEGKSGENGNDEESPEEQTYRRAIEQEKAIYKESFERLRILKPEIEHVRKLLEKTRGTMQSQFDQWYNNLHAKGMESFDHALANEVENASKHSLPSKFASTNKNAMPSTQAESKDDDTDVNEDIMAFYQAKDELLKRRKG